ncbi:hypothetical protein GCM10010112_91350 [Actinoplanes lobatus]|uniref:N-acetyltransferase domain-containing protein n=1 Tax=Actinoplanes lobatus TaxID=113568 RepID=A0A7W7MLQ0_9ACTN|nr:hypothetical protein [Actinoplanes lobatus]MBB4755102.1 hypothetical protein [Actinoplanes lobatus]GGN98380.1 hypothetical protein GCM10010112_91350 [Actinoplanes lobatus]GIE40582.1 hypothetical protein Alo02nite_34800 [Actinoplanes lobatus]
MEPLDVIGWAGSALLVWSLLQSRLLRLRALNLLGCLVLLGFNAAIGVWPMVGLNVVLAVINLWYLWRMLATRHDDKAYQVVEVRTGDDLLAHILRTHHDDIVRFNPDLTLDGLTRRDAAAFLILNADEVAGVVVFHAAGDGVAQVELDYVTERYRDLTPGEFVFRRSSYFINRGCRTVITPAGMRSPYYDRLGFQPRGDSYVLELAS